MRSNVKRILLEGGSNIKTLDQAGTHQTKPFCSKIVTSHSAHLWPIKHQTVGLRVEANQAAKWLHTATWARAWRNSQARQGKATKTPELLHNPSIISYTISNPLGDGASRRSSGRYKIMHIAAIHILSTTCNSPENFMQVCLALQARNDPLAHILAWFPAAAVCGATLAMGCSGWPLECYLPQGQHKIFNLDYQWRSVRLVHCYMISTYVHHDNRSWFRVLH